MQFDQLATEEMVAETTKSLEAKGYHVDVVKNKSEALEKVKSLIKPGASVMNGASETLREIGFIDYLEQGGHGWGNLHKQVVTEGDAVRRATLRKEATLADYYVGSVHALTAEGEYLVASNTGSQLPHLAFSSPNLILVVSTKKIVENIASAMERLNQYVIPLEDKRMQAAYGVGTALNKILISKGESPSQGRNVHLILVKELLGF